MYSFDVSVPLEGLLFLDVKHVWKYMSIANQKMHFLGESFFQFALCHKKLASFRSDKAAICAKSKLKAEMNYY